MTRRAWLFVIAAAVFLWPAAASADINQPSEIPSDLSDRKDLVSQRSNLLKHWHELAQKIAVQKAQCSAIPDNEPLVVEDCLSNKTRIESEINLYKGNLQKYEDEVGSVDSRFSEGRPDMTKLYRPEDEKYKKELNSLPPDMTRPTPKQPFLRSPEYEEKMHTIMVPTLVPVAVRVPKSVEEKHENPHGNENPIPEADQGVGRPK